jgi:hypothetical protein
MGTGRRVVVALAMAATQLPRSVGQGSSGATSDDDRRTVVQTYQHGLTSGDMSMIGQTDAYDCVMRVTGDARFCAVNFQPIGALNDLGSERGICVGVQPPCEMSVQSDARTLSAPVNAGPTHISTGGSGSHHGPPSPCYNGLPPPCSGPMHHPRDNACYHMRGYSPGVTAGEEELIQADHISQADCTAGQDYSGTHYCAVNFYALTSLDSTIPEGRCMGVLPPCGAVEPNAEAETAPLPVDHTGDCSWSDPPPPPRPPPPTTTPPPPTPPSPMPPPPETGVPIGQQSLLCSDGSLQVCSDGTQHRAVFCRTDLDYTLGPATKQVCAADHQAACSCDCCTCSDGELPACPREAPPTEECDDATVSTLFENINNICCAGQDCSNGPPAVCNQRCADIMMDAWENSACQAVLQTMMGDSIASFVQLCEDPSDEVYTDPDDDYTCSYTELINLVLECTVAEEEDCTSTCIVHMRPFLQQCGEVMSDMIAAVEPATQSFQEMVMQCDGATATGDIAAPTGSNKAADFASLQVCDISSIMATCSHLDADLAAATTLEALCSTPCVHLVVESFDACSTDPSQQVQQQFSADQWQPVVTECAQQAPAPSPARQQEDHCDGAMVTVLATVNDICCPGGCAQRPPKSCSSSCADAFMPVRNRAGNPFSAAVRASLICLRVFPCVQFYEECGSALAAADGQLESRLHGLYEMCDSAGHGSPPGGGH